MKRTITIDTDLHKVVPLVPDGKLQTRLLGHNRLVWQDLLERVPDALPGVVAHSGEPCAWDVPYASVEQDGSMQDHGSQLVYADDAGLYECGVGIPLFTYPPAQPDTEALKARVAELERFERMFMAAMSDLGDIHDALELDPDDAAGALPIIEEIAKIKADITKFVSMECDRTKLDRITASRKDRDEKLQIAAQAGQVSVGYLAEDGYFIVSDEWTAKFRKAPRHVPLYIAPPAPANSLAIVQAALEAAKQAVKDRAVGSEIFVENAVDAIDGIDHQAIIDAATKGQQ